MLLNADQFFSDKSTPSVNQLNAAFLISLSGEDHPLFSSAFEVLNRKYDDPAICDLAEFFQNRIRDIEIEISTLEELDSSFINELSELTDYLKQSSTAKDENFHDKVWKVFFPEGVEVLSDPHRHSEILRESRVVDIKKLNPDPIKEPGREMLFTGNVLLGLPNAKTNIDELNYDKDLKDALNKVVTEPQLFWFDHPVQIGVAPEANEILYGLIQLDKSLEEERKRGNLGSEKVKCLLSVSVTHKGLHKIAKQYISQELQQHSNLQNLEVFVFTEDDTQQLIREVFVPMIKKDQDSPDAEKLLDVFGVDGEYGRHYSFLKAIAAVWQVVIDPAVKATFKIDLDQVFPQKELIEQSGASAFEHFQNPLWGATGIGKNGEELELGMIAGALVNEKDIHKGLFTPDVTFPENIPDQEANIFFSKLLMALSTEGELMTRYGTASGIDGKSKCIERIHVTGGTNGILVKSLRKHRSFTPSYIGRAEDQCYILSVLGKKNGSRLAYLHEDGLIMRHDKEAFAQEALAAAKFGNIVGDYIRTLYFSAYARTVSEDIDQLKELVNPFTGCFISSMPITVCMLRYAIKGANFFEEGDTNLGDRFFKENAPRLDRAMKFVEGDYSKLQSQTNVERQEWDLFYDTLDKIELLIEKKDAAAIEIAAKAREIIENGRIGG